MEKSDHDARNAIMYPNYFCFIMMDHILYKFLLICIKFSKIRGTLNWYYTLLETEQSMVFPNVGEIICILFAC